MAVVILAGADVAIVVAVVVVNLLLLLTANVRTTRSKNWTSTKKRRAREKIFLPLDDCTT